MSLLQLQIMGFEVAFFKDLFYFYLSGRATEKITCTPVPAPNGHDAMSLLLPPILLCAFSGPDQRTGLQEE